MIKMLANGTVVILLQYINGSNQYVYTSNVYNAVCQLCLNKKIILCFKDKEKQIRLVVIKVGNVGGGTGGR